MNCDIVLAGVGGQGVLSVSVVIARAASSEGFEVRQSETHGMAQRGGAVEVHLRLSRQPIASNLISRGSAQMILGLEPLESLRHLDLLAPDGVLVTSSEPVENIADYPPQEELLDRIRKLPRAVVVDTRDLARRAGSAKTANVVLLGAAASFLPFPVDALGSVLADMFRSKGERALEANRKAFRLGRKVAIDVQD